MFSLEIISPFLSRFPFVIASIPTMDDGNNVNKTSATPLNIAVIGAGLVGSLSACYLARQGHNVQLFDYREDVRKVPAQRGRSVNLAVSTRGRAALNKIGLEGPVIEGHALPLTGRMIHSLKGTNYPIPYDVVNNQCIYSANRKYMNELLVTAAEMHPNVKLFFKTKFLSLNLKEGTMALLRAETNEVLNLDPDLIIGADGAHSTVRTELLKHPMFNYSQEYIEHGYKELYIPPGTDGQFLMEPNYLHIWPRQRFMMIALPNQDKSWTVTLFMPFKMFAEINSPTSLVQFFRDNFPDALKLISETKLISGYFSRPPSCLISVKCKPFHFGNKVLLIGDAAHAMVPFFGQGMNAGFEDCLLLDKLMTRFHNDLNVVLPEFSKIRCPDAQAICDLAMYNYVEMRELVNTRTFLLRKRLDNVLYRILSNNWLPLYNAVTFTEINYTQCVERKKFQDQVIWSALLMLIGAMVFMIFQFRASFINQLESPA